MLIGLLAVGAVGHMILWVALVNRLHGLGIRRRWVDLLTGLCGAAFLLAPAGVWRAIVGPWLGLQAPPPGPWIAAAWAYVALCAAICLGAVVARWRWQQHPERGAAITSNHTTRLSIGRGAEPLYRPGVFRWLGRLPGNEATALCVQEKHLVIPRLPQAAEGIRIVHLTDLHMSGRIARTYFEQVVEEVNRRHADLVAITGDIVECAPCLDWIPFTLARLKASSGVYFVLGNHDRNAGPDRLVAMLRDAGLVYLGGTCRDITIRGVTVRLAGNELPWFKPAGDLRNCPPSDPTGEPLKILLSHSPDQFRWAQEQGFDLMLAGHVHGGQVCFPVLGPITAPSIHGVRYAAGVFRGRPTLLHVSRGVSSLTPLRLRCPPEIAVLQLHAATR